MGPMINEYQLTNLIGKLQELRPDLPNHQIERIKRKIRSIYTILNNTRERVPNETCERAHPDKNGFRVGEEYYIIAKERYEWCNKYIVGKTVLDIPGGMGFGSSFMSGYKKLYSIDIDKQSSKEGSSKYESIKFITGDITLLPIKSKSIDIVICFEGIEHISKEKQKLLFAEINRVMKDDGLSMITVPVVYIGRKQSGNKFHIYEPTPEEVKEYIDKYFIIVEKQELLKNDEGYNFRAILRKK
jgi:SAM-dependent methyltransferase